MARKILLADDSVTAQNMGRKILADAGYEVITVNNGSAALKKIAEAKPDLIVLDVYMPGYSGLEVCQRLKEAQETSRIPVMLTVGKLEPFKPEEAKRVRAEGFIVKPFEASELLAALAKLEDKIVPRAEASKPGRFARANAALDEGRYDKTVAVEEDSGWKNRIAFPSKKKKTSEEQEDGDDPAIYNAVNKDLRTVVDHKPAHQPHEVKEEEARVDLGALAPEGLPKDVTPEEIAALAAAAAQVKGKFAESTVAEFEHPAPVPEVKLAEAPVVEDKTEVTADAKDEVQPAAELQKESTAATFASQKPEEPVESSAQKAETAKESTADVPSPAEMMAAIAGLVPDAAGQATDSSFGTGSGSHTSLDQHAPEASGAERPAANQTELDQPKLDQPERDQAATKQPAEEPVTMAAAAGAGFAGSSSRWSAVAVALAPEETSISLEQEMQKAHAAFAAAEKAQAESVAALAYVPPVAAESAPVETLSPVEAVTPELVGPVSAIPAPEAQAAPAPTEITEKEVVDSIAAPAAIEPIAPVVKEFETVAASYSEPESAPPPPVPAEPEPAPVQAVEPAIQSSREASPSVEAETENIPVVEAPAPQTEPTKPEIAIENAPQPVQEEHQHEELKRPENTHEEPVPVVAVTAPVADEPSAVSSETRETVAPTVENDVAVRQAFADQTSDSHVSSGIAAPAAPGESVGGGVAKKESEIAETTAAAWASWRRIREVGDTKATTAKTKSESSESKEEQPPQDEAAMAVAAGAESSPDDVPAQPQDSGEIASIVDSVLADLRPKIVAEISKKMGKKK